MNFFRLLSSIMLLSSICLAKCEQRIAVIDTGIYPDDPRYKGLLCHDKRGFDFVTKKPVAFDVIGHGTAVTNLIIKHAGKANYCLLEYRWYDGSGGWSNLYREIDAIKQAIIDGATIVNLSGGGDRRSSEECEIIRNASDVLFIVAAGNNGRDISKKGYFPASCGSPNLVPVGAINKDDIRLSFSNFGDAVKAWELGLSVEVQLPYGGIGHMSGTSMSTAIHTGKTILQRSRQCGTIR